MRDMTTARRRRIGALIDRLASLGALPSDEPEERLRKGTLTFFAFLMTTFAFVWVFAYGAMGLYLPASIPFIYQVASVTSLATFFRTKRYGFFRASQLVLALILPVAFQWTLGGYVSGSSVAVWSFTSPLGAVLFLGRRRAIPWFVAFVASLALLGALDPYIAAHGPDVPSTARLAFFVMNFTGVAVVTYALLQYFVRERDRAMAALDREHRLLEAEQEKSERLLLNVLPAPIARRLKDGEEVIADGFDDVSVVFADLVGFTPLAERLGPDRVVELLNGLFSAFDVLAGERGLEKIKTIGDAYMVAVGVPYPRPDHADAAADMALAMREETARYAGQVGFPLAVRIGIDSGPVIGGVIGRRRFIYDVWGDTVNTASRMESHGVGGGIQVTERTFRRLQDRYRFDGPRRIAVKGKGEMDVYLLVGRSDTAPAPDSLDHARS